MLGLAGTSLLNINSYPNIITKPLAAANSWCWERKILWHKLRETFRMSGSSYDHLFGINRKGVPMGTAEDRGKSATCRNPRKNKHHSVATTL